MEDRDFFDQLFQLWKNTTGAEDRYWMPEPHFDRSGRFNIYAVAEDDSRKQVAAGMSERDSDFVTAIHGCFADLWRRLHAAVDESDRADYDRDSRECRIAELEMEVQQLQNVVEKLSQKPPWNNR